MTMAHALIIGLIPDFFARLFVVAVDVSTVIFLWITEIS
jgi:hypothetical protein